MSIEPNYDANYLHALHVEHEQCVRILDNWLNEKWAIPPLRFRENYDYLLTLVQTARESTTPLPPVPRNPWLDL